MVGYKLEELSDAQLQCRNAYLNGEADDLTDAQILWYIATGFWLTERQGEHVRVDELRGELVAGGILD